MLSTAETLELQQLESVIERGLRGFFEAGRALSQIRDSKLYRQKHESFEDYCRERWQISKSRAYELMNASSVVAQLSATAEVLPENEAQVRPLTRLEPEQRSEAWESAQTLAGGTPTAAVVTRAAKAMKAQQPAFEEGQQVMVVDENSPYYGKQVEVVNVDGVIVRAKTETGDEPFLTTELSSNLDTARPQPVERNWTAQRNKADRMEALEATLQVEQLRIRILEQMIARFIAAAKRGDISPELLSEAQNLLA
jgi:hypothetical protein